MKSEIKSVKEKTIGGLSISEAHRRMIKERRGHSETEMNTIQDIADILSECQRKGRKRLGHEIDIYLKIG